MAISKVMFDATMKVARANPGVVVDRNNSSLHDLLLVHPKKNKRWHIDHRGKIRRVVEAR